MREMQTSKPSDMIGLPLTLKLKIINEDATEFKNRRLKNFIQNKEDEEKLIFKFEIRSDKMFQRYLKVSSDYPKNTDEIDQLIARYE